MSAGILTPQEAAERAVAERGFGAGGDDYSAAVRAIELFEASRKRVQLTPEQAKAFEERVGCLSAELAYCAALFSERTSNPGEVRLTLPGPFFRSESLRQLAAVCEALATNLERFPV